MFSKKGGKMMELNSKERAMTKALNNSPEPNLVKRWKWNLTQDLLGVKRTNPNNGEARITFNIVKHVTEPIKKVAEEIEKQTQELSREERIISLMEEEIEVISREIRRHQGREEILIAMLRNFKGEMGKEGRVTA